MSDNSGRNCLRVGMLVALAFVFAMSGGWAVGQKESGKATGEWPQMLGPQRNGVSSETGLLDRWPEGGPKVVWRVPGGVGMSGLAVSRGRVLTLIHRDGKQTVVALWHALGVNPETTTINDPQGRPQHLVEGKAMRELV